MATNVDEFEQVVMALKGCYWIISAKSFGTRAAYPDIPYPFIFIDVTHGNGEVAAAPGLVYVEGKWRVHPPIYYKQVDHAALSAYDNWEATVVAFKMQWRGR